MNPNWQKSNGLLPAIIIDSASKQVLMLGYMNEQSYKKTLDTKKVHFYSRTKKRLWMKGETSGNILQLHDIKIDCDNDTFLVEVISTGPVCHTGDYTCFGEDKKQDTSFLSTLFATIQKRKKQMPKGSYTTSLFTEGQARIAQKVGEEATEVVIASMKENSKEEIINETADLLYHLIVLLTEKGIELNEIEKILQSRSS